MLSNLENLKQAVKSSGIIYSDVNENLD